MSKEIELTRRRVLGGIAGISIAAGATGAGSFALLSDSETNSNNDIQAGTVDLSIGGGGSALPVDIDNVQSGSSGDDTVGLTNNGSIDAKAMLEIRNVRNREGSTSDGETNTGGSGELGKYLIVETGFDRDDDLTTEDDTTPALGPGPINDLAGDTRKTGHQIDANGGTSNLYLDWGTPNINNDAQGDRVLFDLFVTIEEDGLAIDDNNADRVVDPGGGGTNTQIKGAVNSASAGDTILVKDGTYTRDFIIDKPLTIVSENGRDSTIIEGDGSIDFIGSPSEVVGIDADDVLLNGFTIDGTSSSQGAIQLQAGLSNVEVSCNRLIGGSASAPVLGTTLPAGYSDLVIAENLFEGVASLMLYINGTASGGNASTGVDITNNYFNGDTQSTSELAVGVESTDGTIADNGFYTDIADNPFALLELFGANNDVSDNTFDVPEDGIGIKDSDGYNNNTLRTNNTFFGDGTDVSN